MSSRPVDRAFTAAGGRRGAAARGRDVRGALGRRDAPGPCVALRS